MFGYNHGYGGWIRWAADFQQHGVRTDHIGMIAASKAFFCSVANKSVGVPVQRGSEFLRWKNQAIDTTLFNSMIDMIGKEARQEEAAH